MQSYLSLILACALLVGCGSTPVTEKPAAAAEQKSQWQASTLSQQTIDKANAVVQDYRLCLSDETKARINDQGDSRAIADLILRQCEPRLTPVKTLFDAEQVPAEISERYLRKNRSHGAQFVLRTVMAAQAMRAGEEEEAKQKDNSKKKKK